MGHPKERMHRVSKNNVLRRLFGAVVEKEMVHRVSKNNVVRRLFGAEVEKETGCWRKLRNGIHCDISTNFFLV